MAEDLRSERNQGRNPDRSKNRPRPPRLQLTASPTSSAAIGVAQLEKLEPDARREGAGRRAYTEALAELGGAPVGDGRPTKASSFLPCANRGQEKRSWFV